MRNNLLKIAGALAVFAIIVSASSAAAQTTTLLPQITRTMTIDTRPQQPAPGDTVELSARSFSIDLDRAEITWFVDDEVVRSGVGAKTITITAGSLGSERRILLRAEDNSTILEAETLIRPTAIDLVWEAAGAYAPPLYRGKTLVSNNGTARIVALAHFTNPGSNERLSNNELVFTWSRDGRVLGSKSGTGKNVLITEELLPFRSTRFSVEIRSLDDALTGKASVIIEPVTPNVFLYELHPLLGTLFNRALSAVTLSGREEFVASAYPYFIDASQRDVSQLVYEWSINGRAVDNPSEHPGTIVLRQSSPDARSADISVAIAHTQKIFQRAQGAFSLSFTTRGARGTPESENVF